MNIVLYISCALLGIVLDWAIHGRFVLYIESLRGIRPNHDYRRYVFPRILLTICGSALMAYGSTHAKLYNLAFLLGLLLFLASNVYSIVKSYLP